jgi:hypothetical protein
MGKIITLLVMPRGKITAPAFFCGPGNIFIFLALLRKYLQQYIWPTYKNNFILGKSTIGVLTSPSGVPPVKRRSIAGF